jgi:pyruvate,water dikinase
MAPVAAGFALLSVMDRWLSAWLKEPGAPSLRLMRGVRNTTTDMNLRLWDAAQAIRAGTVTHEAALANFLAVYGQRGSGELDIATPRWRDDPAALNQTLESYLQLDDPEAAPDAVFARGAREAEALGAELITRARDSHPLLGRLRARLLRFALGRARLFTAHRETPKQRMIDVIGAFRRALLRQGEALAARGLLSRADDIFWLPLGRLDAIAAGAATDLMPLVAEARAAHAAHSAWPRFPRVMLSTGESFYGSVDVINDDPNALLGDGVSPGVAEGLAHVIADPRSERLEPGEILVCIGTDPGWTPLFLAARGLVTEVGGMITHGSVVAREYGIPAVVGVEAATSRIKTGQRIRIDGASGRVTLLADKPVNL